jgi:hypothetical protein
MSLLVAMLFAVAQEPPKLVEIERLSPSAAGALILADRDHGAIEAMVSTPSWAVALPNTVNLELVEKAAKRGHGCLRQRWMASFTHIAKPREAATLSTVRSVTEVALRSARTCSGAAYVELSGHIEADDAIEALKQFEHIRTSGSQINFSCSDRTASNLCATPNTIRRELWRLSLRTVMRNGDEIVFRLGPQMPNQPVTQVHYKAGSARDIIVSREIPLPF